MKLSTKKNHIVEMCILKREPCPFIFQGMMALGLSYFFEKYFVFALIFPKPYVQFAGVHITKRMLFPTVERNYGIQSNKGAGISCTIWWCPAIFTPLP
jgi:hypothetical protein